MNFLKLIVENKSGYERQQVRFKIIKLLANGIKLRDNGTNVDGLVEELIQNEVLVDFHLKTVGQSIDSQEKSPILVKSKNSRNHQ